MHTKQKLANLAVCLAGALCFSTGTTYLNNANFIANASNQHYQNSKDVNVNKPNDSSSNSVIQNDSKVKYSSMLAPKLKKSGLDADYNLQIVTYFSDYDTTNMFKSDEKRTK